MQVKGFTEYIQWRASALMQGRHEDLARHFRPPVSISVDGQTYTLGSHDDIVLDLHRLRIALLDLGIQELEPRVVAIELPKTTQRVWVTWKARDQQGAAHGSASTVYQFDRTGPDLRAIALANYSVLVPEFANPAFRNRLQRSRMVTGQ